MKAKYIRFLFRMIFWLVPVFLGMAGGVLFERGEVVWPIILAIASFIATTIYGGLCFDQGERSKAKEMKYGKIHFSE